MPKNNKTTENKLSTEAYKGVRDFFPEDMAVEKAIFDIWRNVAEKYGYEEYAASVLEPAELYRAKSGEEIVNEQTYTFTDRGDREVTLRPEMTPTVARMVAARRRELAFPLRWYSIPNLFRYEQPQRGRLREHWQLNVDIFGADSAAAEIEVIGMACDITRAYGLGNKDFEVRINNRELMNHLMKNVFHLDNETAHKLSKLIDKKAKMPREKFIEAIEEIVGDSSASSRCIELLEAKDIETFEKLAGGSPNGVNGGTIAGLDRIREVINGLKKLDQLNRLDQTEVNIRFDPTLMRGFDYYTGIIFEIFDLNPNNRRSIFGGGRYDDLLSLFGNEKVTAVGFGAGDVIARDLMETYSTLEKFTHAHTPADVSICLIGNDNATHDYAFTVAKILREQNICTSIDFSNKKTGDKIAAADKRRIPFVIVIGDEEIKSNQIVLKKLATKEEKLFNSAEFKDIGNYIKNKKCAP